MPGGCAPAVCAIALAAACWGGEPDALRVTLADGAKLEAHWNASLFGQVWNEPGLAALRDRFDGWLAVAKRDTGVDFPAAARAARGIQLRFLGIDGKKQPRWAVQADLGMQAPQIARRLAKSEGSALPLVVAGADEAWTLSAQSLARFGGIVAFGRPADLLPLAPASGEGDLALDVDVSALLAMLRAALEPAQAARSGPLIDLLAKRLHSLSMRASLDDGGVAWSGRFDGDTSCFHPVDRSLLARLPANASTVQLIGVDGASWWKAWGGELVAAVDAVLHEGRASSAEATLGEIRAGLAALGLDVGLPELVQGFSGTVVIAQTPGAPFPGFTVAVPRSPALDAVVAGLCARLGCKQPDEGGYALLPIPNVPLPIQLARDRGHWLLSTDILLASTWGGGAAGGFDATPMGREIAKAPAEACILGANDLAPSLRMSMGLINMGVGLVGDLSHAEQQSIVYGVARLATVLPPGYHWGVAKPGRLDLQGHGGDILWVAMPAVIAAIAIPNLLESRVVANEAAAAATLKAGIFAAEVQFQGGAYRDDDGDNVGEYGLLSELSGRRGTGKVAAGTLNLLNGPLAKGDNPNGYRFAAFVPDGQGGAIGEPDGEAPRASVVDGVTVLNADDQERFWVVYAWPLTTESGRRVFAIDQAGQVYVQPWDGSAPGWNSLYGGNGTWGAKPTWPRYHR